MKTSRFAAAALAMLLSACSLIPDGPLFSEETLSGVNDPDAGLPSKVAVVRIENLELGRLFNGYMLTAIAIAPGTGYYQPELRPRYGGEPGPDGFYEFDFVARPPATSGGGDAPITARSIRGDVELSPQMLRTGRGVRVWSARDSVEGRF